MTDPNAAPTLTFIIGCTGSGKGTLGRALARLLGAEIISADSMKVYRRMDIGTAKPAPEIRAALPHHLIDVVEPSDSFSVAQYLELAEAAIVDIAVRSKPILVVGGTPMYIKALTEGMFEGPGANESIRDRLRTEAEHLGIGHLHERLQTVDPEAAARIHPNDQRRLVRALEVYELTGSPITELQQQWDRQRRRYPCRFIGLRRERPDQSHRTNLRVQRMLDAGLLDEVTALAAEPDPLSDTARQALGYAEMLDHLAGELTLAEAVEKIKINTRKLAKAQRTWFKRFLDADWLDLAPDDDLERLADDVARRLED